MQVMLVIVPVIIILASLVAIFSPRTGWYIQEGWKYKNVVPSDGMLLMVRIGGIAGVIAGIVFLIVNQNMF